LTLEAKSETDEVVYVAKLVLTGAFFLVDYPYFIIYDVLVEMVASRQMQCGKPLVSVGIKHHFMSLVPIVEATTKLDSRVTRTSVVQHE